MATPETVGTATVLCNEAYITKLGVKRITLGNRDVVVHETSNLRDLIDAYFRELQGIAPRDFNEQIASAKLAGPAVHFILQAFMRLQPELREQLEVIAQRREVEVANRREIRSRAERGITISPDLTNTGPSEKEQAFRDFVYSQTLDYIGELVSRYGLDFDLYHLVE